jgi:hypothetical protein
MNTYSSRYATMHEDDLYREAEGVQNLVAEAREALRDEFVRRHLSVKKINWKAKASFPRRFPKTSLVGDCAGEFREMERGKYHAWIHVSVAFALQIVFFDFLFAVPVRVVIHSDLLNSAVFVLATFASLLVYWNRWRCIEAFSSTYCTGIFGISLLSVPLITFFYANYRGLRKMLGK